MKSLQPRRFGDCKCRTGYVVNVEMTANVALKALECASGPSVYTEDEAAAIRKFYWTAASWKRTKASPRSCRWVASFEVVIFDPSRIAVVSKSSTAVKFIKRLMTKIDSSFEATYLLLLCYVKHIYIMVNADPALKS